jgi:hypothetical protein
LSNSTCSSSSTGGSSSSSSGSTWRGSGSSSNARCGLHLLGAADVAGLALAVATAGWGSPQLLRTLADRAEGLVGEMNGQQLSQVSNCKKPSLRTGFETTVQGFKFESVP